MQKHFWTNDGDRITFSDVLDMYGEFLTYHDGLIEVCGEEFPAGEAYRKLNPQAFKAEAMAHADFLRSDGELYDYDPTFGIPAEIYYCGVATIREGFFDYVEVSFDRNWMEIFASVSIPVWQEGVSPDDMARRWPLTVTVGADGESRLTDAALDELECAVEDMLGDGADSGYSTACSIAVEIRLPAFDYGAGAPIYATAEEMCEAAEDAFSEFLSTVNAGMFWDDLEERVKMGSALSVA